MELQDDSHKTSEPQLTKAKLDECRLAGYEKCEYCEQDKTDIRWCKTCNAEHFSKLQWESGNNIIDSFIRGIQNRAVNHHRVLEWVSFKNFENVECIAEGGYGIVYKAKWIGGRILYFDSKTQDWHRSGDMDVVLKCLHNLNNTTEQTEQFLKEKFMIIMNFMEDGSLRDYIGNKFSTLTWIQKLEILYTAANGLYNIHEAKLIHQDLHTGNIVLSGQTSYITDFGFCQPDNYKSSEGAKKSEIFGVLAYLAPEILCGGKHTMATDKYSFEILINETNKKITPLFVINLIKRCWNQNPEDRPQAKELQKCLGDCTSSEFYNSYISSRVSIVKSVRVSHIESASDSGVYGLMIPDENDERRTRQLPL
ncbi:9947_t:CDS:2 [Acaulospora morrowiae]|uniref:9947_t:CDS:1 n=1 Tax=Acaulospora morrowiae TaxID=94023 RepID=A0A9N8VH12_9GLOM|nr:9947_t:CDS:2 [Acaulospora morrowiae]